MRTLRYWAFSAILLGSAFGQVNSAMLHVKYGEPTQEVFTVRPGYHLTVFYGSEHQACRLDISSGQADSFEKGKETNRVLDEIVEELVPESTRGFVKGEGTLYTGFGGQMLTTYESLTISRTELLTHSTGVLSTAVTLTDKSCSGVMHQKQRGSQ